MYVDNRKNDKRLPRLKRWAIALSAAVAMSCGPVWATTDCQVTLQSAYVGDIHGDGTNALFLVYTYTASNGAKYTGQGYTLLSNPTAAYISSVVIEAHATQQMAFTIRYENGSGDPQDVVCEASSARSDLIGVWLPSSG